MSRLFSRLSASGFSLRLASITIGAACFLTTLVLPGVARAQGLLQSPSPSLATGTAPQGVAAADFARSGFQSLVVGDSTNKNMKIYLATGPNTFGGATTIPACTGGGANVGPGAVIAHDFNEDGYPDIVVACPSANVIQLFLNNGAGGFPATPSASLPVTNPVAMAAGDFVGTGLQDMAVATGTGGITVFVDVAGTVVTKTTAQTGTLSGITVGDFNHDGLLDVAVSDSANSNVHVLTGNGTGALTLLGSYSTGSGTKPSGIVAADFNQDGNLDVVTSNAGNNTATVLLGSATGALTLKPGQATATNPIGLVVADINSDGYPDVVAFDAPTTTSGSVDVLLGNGDGTLQGAQSAAQGFKPGTVAAVADFNRDGKPDIALTEVNLNLAAVMLNNTLPTQYPDGRSYAAFTGLTNGKGNFADGVAVGDFNKDGNLDIAVSYLEDNTVQVLLNNGSNGFNASTTYAVGKQPYWIASGDLNGDGYPDLVTANTTDGTITVLLNKGKTGGGAFNAPVPYTVGAQPFQVAIGDVNNDGFPDLAVTNYGANTVTILFGSKTGTFTVQPATLATCANPYGVAIGDFRHNNYPSVAVTCYGAAELQVFPNNGNGTFGTPFITATETNPASLVVGDFNRDGKLDIVAANTTPNDIEFYAGNGNNTFGAGVESPSLNFPDSIAAADFNGDGILDIVGVSPNFDSVELTLGQGNGSFGTFNQRAAGIFADTKQPWAVAVGDFNNDGQTDIVTANTYNQVNITSPANQSRYLTQYPAVPGGNPSISVLTNASAAQITLTSSPASPLPYNNTGTTLTASVQPAYTGVTPTGAVLFEDATGAPLGGGAYPLTGGAISVPTGHLGSGAYLFTTLYSGDANFQPTTASGSAFTLTVSGTPVTLTLNKTSVGYASTFTATVTVTGTVALGAPHGTVTIVGSLGTLATINLTAAGNNATGNATYTAVLPNFSVGTYNLYALYNPTNGYPAGSSSNVGLTVTGEPTTTGVTCGFGLLTVPCTATVTASTTGTPVPAGNIVNFSVNGGAPVTETIGANGQANYSFNETIGTFTVVATFPQQSNYLTSTGNTAGGCVIICLLRTSGPISFNAFTGTATNDHVTNPGLNAKEGRSTPFTLF